MKKYRLSGFEILEFEEADSTNTLAASLPSGELGDKSVVLTFKQTHGRGQTGNKWESEPGRNIAMTAVFKPFRLDAGQQFAISMVVALGCCDLVSSYVSGASVKWPNDVYVGDKKIAGILIEHTISGAYIGCSLCGLGLNVNQAEFLSDAPNPVSLRQLLGGDSSLHTILEELLDCIGRRYAMIHNYPLLERDYMDMLYRRGGEHDWMDKHGKFRASILRVDGFGQLVLKDSDGKERVYGFKEVSFI